MANFAVCRNTNAKKTTKTSSFLNNLQRKSWAIFPFSTRERYSGRICNIMHFLRVWRWLSYSVARWLSRSLTSQLMQQIGPFTRRRAGVDVCHFHQSNRKTAISLCHARSALSFLDCDRAIREKVHRPLAVSKSSTWEIYNLLRAAGISFGIWLLYFHTFLPSSDFIVLINCPWRLLFQVLMREAPRKIVLITF